MPRNSETSRPKPARVISFQRGDGAKALHPPPRDDRRITLLMLSGGFDSVYFLYKLLEETDDYVVAHHVNLVNPEGRHLEERQACHRIVAWLRENLRWFEYGETTIDHRTLPVFGFDIVSVGFEAGVVSHSIFGIHGRMPDRWIVGMCTEEGPNPERRVHVENCVAANCYPEAPPPLDTLPVVTKAEEIARLPPDLRDMVWYCRRPVRDEGRSSPCGVCSTCDLVDSAVKSLRESAQD